MTSALIKHWRLVSLVLGIIILLLVLYLLRTVILPFALGLVLAYLLVPVVSWLEQKLPPPGKWLRFKRVFSTLVAFIILIGIIGGFFYLIATAVIDASLVLLENAPEIFGRGFFQLREWFEALREQLPPEIRLEVDKALLEWGMALGNVIRNAVLGGISAMPHTLSTLFGFAALPFFLFYIMKDSERLKRGFYSAFTPVTAQHVRNIVTIIERVLGQYIRAQLMLGLIVAYFAFIGLMLILKIRYAPALAMLAGITEVIPTLGPWIGGAVAVFVTLAVSPEKAIWVVVLFLIIQLVENNFFVPRIQSAYLRIHPAVMIVLLVLGAYLAGFWGLLLAGPLAATLIEVFKYVRKQYQVESVEQPAEPEQPSS